MKDLARKLQLQDRVARLNRYGQASPLQYKGQNAKTTREFILVAKDLCKSSVVILVKMEKNVDVEIKVVYYVIEVE